MMMTSRDLYELIKDATGLGFYEYQNNFGIIRCRIVDDIIPEFRRRYQVRISANDDFVTDNNIYSVQKLLDVLNSYLGVPSTSVSASTSVTYKPYNSNVSSQISNLSRLSKNIKEDQTDVSRLMNKINSSSAISIDRHWYGAVDRESIEKGFDTVYRDFSDVIKNCCKAINKTNGNLGMTLDLIKGLALAENELYNQFDKQATSSNEFRDTFIQFCKEQGINDDTVRELLDCSFQRTYTLRDRINKLRNELMPLINKCSRDVENINGKYQNLDTEIRRVISKTTEELRSILSTDKQNFEKFYSERVESFRILSRSSNSNLNEIKQKIESYCNDQLGYFLERQQTISSYVSQIEALKSDIIKISSQAKTDIKIVSEQEQKNISDKSDEMIGNFTNKTKAYFEELNKQKMEISKSKQDVIECISSKRNEFQVWYDELMNQMSSQLSQQQHDFEVEKENLKMIYNKRLIWTIASSVGISVLFSVFLICLLG